MMVLGMQDTMHGKLGTRIVELQCLLTAALREELVLSNYCSNAIRQLTTCTYALPSFMQVTKEIMCM